MSEEIAKLALECLKTWLDGERAKAEAWARLSELLDGFLTETLPKVLSEYGEVARPGRRVARFELTKEDLMLFAKSMVSVKGLEQLIADLTEVLEARKREEAEGR